MSSATVRERHRRIMQGNPPRFRRARAGRREGVRRWRVVPLAIGVVSVLLVAVTGKLFVWPAPGSAPAHVDAVFVLSGSGADRLHRAIGLMDRGIASILILPNGASRSWAAANPLCGRLEPYQVQCPAVASDSVRAESRVIRDLSRVKQWRLVLVVTSRYNMSRARYDLHRCLGNHFAMSSSTAKDSPITKVRQVGDEWVSTFQDVVLHRSC